MLTDERVLERLIEEAGRRGAAEHQRDDLVSALDKAADGLQKTTAALSSKEAHISVQNDTITRLQREIYMAVDRGGQVGLLLRDLTEAADRYIRSCPKPSQKQKGLNGMRDVLINTIRNAEQLLGIETPF